MPVKVTPILKATLVDCIAACTIGACFFWLLLLQNLPPPDSVRHSVLFPSISDDACVSPVRQDLKLLVSYRTERNFPSPPTQDFPCSSATLTLIWFAAMQSFGQAHGIFVESAECSTELLGKSCYYSKQ